MTSTNRARLRELTAPLRRPVAVVLWGGREVDLQAGSPADQERSRRLLIYARIAARASSRMAALAASLPLGRFDGAGVIAGQAAIARLGASAREAQARLAELGEVVVVDDALRRARFRARASALSLERSLELERQRLAITHPGQVERFDRRLARILEDA